MGNPNVHDHANLPILVAGGAAGGMKGGRHIRFAEPTPLANLHLTLLDKVGVRLDAFADSKGKVDELLVAVSDAMNRMPSPATRSRRCARARRAPLRASSDAPAGRRGREDGPRRGPRPAEAARRRERRRRPTA